jgi:hypothetical protein
MNMADAGRRVLERSRKQQLAPTGTLVMAAAGVAVEADGGDAFRAADELSDRGLALLITAAAEALRPAGRRGCLLSVAQSIPAANRAMALACSECFLARINPAWAADLYYDLLGAEEISTHGSIGLAIAARAELEGVSVRSWVLDPPPSRSLYARQLAADSLARAVAFGLIQHKGHTAFAPLHETPPGRFLLPSEAGAYLAAAAMLDPAWGLDVAEGLLRTHAAADIDEALYVSARIAVRAGMAEAVALLPSQSGFIAEQACWTEVAARSGALPQEAIVAIVRELAPRVGDELDPGRELIAGLPLLMALAHAGDVQALMDLAAEWRVPPPVVADRLLYVMAQNAAATLCFDDRFGQLCMMSDAEWNASCSYYPGWWLDAGFKARTRLSACRDVLTLAAAVPWKTVPGSLLEIVSLT